MSDWRHQSQLSEKGWICHCSLAHTSSVLLFHQVSGRLHVEVVRVSGEIDDRLVGGEDSPDYFNENDTQERKLVCRVSSRYTPTS